LDLSHIFDQQTAYMLIQWWLYNTLLKWAWHFGVINCAGHFGLINSALKIVLILWRRTLS